MTTQDVDSVVDDYLRRLDNALRALPRSRREQLVAEITEHVNEARAGLSNQNEAAVRQLLDRVGLPDDIAAEALADQPEQPMQGPRRGIAFSLIGLVAVVGVGLGIAALVKHDAHPTGVSGSGPNFAALPAAPDSGLRTGMLTAGPNCHYTFVMVGDTHIPIDHTGAYVWTSPYVKIPSAVLNSQGAVESFTGGSQFVGHVLGGGLIIRVIGKSTSHMALRVTFSVMSFSGKPYVHLLGETARSGVGCPKR